MTIKELEIIISHDNLIDLLIYARCQLCDLGVAMHISDLHFRRYKLYDTLNSLREEIDKIKPNYKTKCVYKKNAISNNE